MSQPADGPDAEDPVELANRLYREYHSRCFWHQRDDVPITRETIPLVLKGLRTNGGRRAFLEAARLERLAADEPCP
ncbi:MAG: hypothetical protein ACRC33_08985 [Gemmataceae bacterium]